MKLSLNEKQNALRIRCKETGKIHVSWIVEVGCEKSIVIFEDIPENYPATDLIIEPFTLERVEDIFDRIYNKWDYYDMIEPDSESFYGKTLKNCFDSESFRFSMIMHDTPLPPSCPDCKNIRLFEMSSEDVHDGLIVEGYLKCSQCGTEWHEDDVGGLDEKI